MKVAFTLATVLCAYLLVQPAVAKPFAAESGESFEVDEQKPEHHGTWTKIPPITIDAKMKATAHVTVPEEVVAAITKLVFELQEEQKSNQSKHHKLHVTADEPAQGDASASAEESERVEQPAEEPEKVEQPAEEPEKVEQPAEEAEKIEQAAEEPEKVEQPAEQPEKAERPTEEPEV
ncbi:uncharacterized abhydrolase domain-containing protein DDB_G0269086-like [Eurosta solidaginis]|uniref:uncharacterized abhydrolase domain-containing protein DDB_G0269086-like n=1 Tax=Eurosta solidaginis TaxID=178769 RepID=UPI00353123F8